MPSTPAPDGPSTPNGDAPAGPHLADCRTSHVVKRMAPDQAGAMKLAARFGDRLVCVRYRHDAAKRRRYTTVELVVASAPIKGSAPNTARARKMQIVAIRLHIHERDLRVLLYESGATCAPDSGLWYVPKSIAKALGLLHRVV